MATIDPLQAMNDAQNALNVVSAESVQGIGQPWSESLVLFLSVSVLFFVGAVLVLCTALLWRAKASAPEILKIFGIMSIVGLSALLLITGFSNEQLTPIVGLFGAIAGYLLGRESRTEPGNAASSNEQLAPTSGTPRSPTAAQP
ncbi:MAG: hypothetical protein LJE70_13280 [Chromatiaceae bacterium]|jgi:hypothetical protein|nr:hypothetical protein [Chromatiaceae bacterium]